MTLNYIILGLVFVAGFFLVITAATNAKFMFGEDIANNPLVTEYQQKRKIPGVKRSRTTYLIVGIFVIILGIVAIFTGFLNEEIKFE